MTLKMYAVKDTVQGEMMNPFLLRNNEEAKRAFGQAINSKQDTNIVNYYRDMQLYELGEYNSTTGEIKSNVQFVCSGIDVKTEEIKTEE